MATNSKSTFLTVDRTMEVSITVDKIMVVLAMVVTIITMVVLTWAEDLIWEVVKLTLATIQFNLDKLTPSWVVH